MRKFIIAVLAVGCCAVASAAEAELKIVVIDPLAAMAGTDQYKKAMGELEKELAPQKAQLTKWQVELNTCKQKMSKDAATMTATETAKLKADCEAKFRDYQALGQNFQSVVNERQQAVMKDIAPKLEKATDAMVKEHGYDLILQREATVFAKPAFDITDKITLRINAIK